MADPQPLSSHSKLLERQRLASPCSPSALLGLPKTINVKQALISDAILIPPSQSTNDNSNNTKRRKPLLLSRNVSLARIQQELKELEDDLPRACVWAGLRDPITCKRHRSSLDQDVATAAAGNTSDVRDDEYMAWVESHYHWQAMVSGPSGTPYEGGIFFLHIDLPRRYPFEAPTVRFTTPIYHCNVRSKDGRICMGLLGGEEWRPAQCISGLLSGICSLLHDPETSTTDDDTDQGVYSDEQRMKLFCSHRSKFDETAREWTRKYAM